MNAHEMNDRNMPFNNLLLGVVVIGRNEGERLENCIQSLAKHDLSDGMQLVYVDSGSTDNSVSFVKSQGYDVLSLDMSIPFSAARARNEGYRFLLKKYPTIPFLQFVDGDCQVFTEWLPLAYQYLQDNASVASVCGRRKERYPDATVLNALCDIEWNTPIGEAAATGGDFMCRSEAIVSVDGFSDQVIAGEEPELCFRLRQSGWKIYRLDSDMTLHDASMTHWGQWWRRNKRAGHAYAQGFYMHGHSEERYYRNDILRILLWAVLIPVLVVGLSFFSLSGLLLLGIYPCKMIQIYWSQARNMESKVGVCYAFSLVVGKLPQLQGALHFCLNLFLKKQFQIIEYKR